MICPIAYTIVYIYIIVYRINIPFMNIMMNIYYENMSVRNQECIQINIEYMYKYIYL